MPALSPRQVHVNVPLTNFSVQYDHLEYLTYRIAPAVDVKKEQDIYYVFNENRESITPVNTERAVGTPAAEVQLSGDTDTYQCKEYALAYKLPDRVRENADDPWRLEQRGIGRTIDLLDLDKERRIQAMFQTFGGAGQPPGANVATKWDDTGGDPEGDIRAAKKIVRQAIGRVPNSMLISADVGNALIGVIKSALTSLDLKTKLTFNDLPDMLWGLKLYIGNAIQNTANAGQTATIADVWNDNVVIFYMDPNPGLDGMNFVSTFRSQKEMVIQWREDRIRSDMYEVNRVEVEKMVAPTAAYVLGDTLL